MQQRASFAVLAIMLAGLAGHALPRGITDLRVVPSLSERHFSWLALPAKPAPRKNTPRPKPPSPAALLGKAEKAHQTGRLAESRELLRQLLDQAPPARLRLAAYRLLARLYDTENMPERALDCLGNAEAVLAQVPLANRRVLLAAVYQEYVRILLRNGRTNEAAVYEWAAWRTVHGPFAPRRGKNGEPGQLSAQAAWLAQPAPVPHIGTNAWFFAEKRGTNPPGLPAGLLPEGLFLEPGFAQPLTNRVANGYRVEMAGETPAFVEGPRGFAAWLETGRIHRAIVDGDDGRQRVILADWEGSGRLARLALIRFDPARDAVGLLPEVRLVFFP
jgi:hypothetical protein